MFDDVRALYNEAILSHSRAPRHGQRLAAFDGSAKGDNPMCGDRITVFVRRENGGVAEAGFEARGCELTRASADLMCEAVAGASPEAVRRMAGDVEAMARTGRCEACGAGMEALRPLSAVHEFPSRVRCVTLPWAALVAALDSRPEGGKEASSG